MSGRAIVRAGVDAWVDQRNPTRNYSTTINLQVGGPTNQIAYGYIFFQNPAPRRATITEAKLRVFGRGQWGTANRTMRVQRIANQVRFGQLNWNNRPGLAGNEVELTQPNNDSVATLWEFNIQPQMQTITNGAANYGFRISCTDTTRRQIIALDAATLVGRRPTLEVAWSDAPQAPTSLVPSGNQVVSIQRPVLQFDYTDVGGNVELAAVQVQIQPQANWSASNVWDSGPVLTSDPELNLAQTNWPGLNNNQGTYWRVRVQDGAGMWSRWSHRANGVGARFQRQTKGALVLLNPTTSGFIEDVTPPVAWQFTGRTQASWRIVLTTPDDPTDWIWTSGRRAGTADSFTIPRGNLTDWGGQYRIMVDIWDQQDRVGTPGDAAFVRAAQNFRLRGDPTVDPVTNLQGSSEPYGARPYMTLTWRRSEMPDEWNILRDGRVIDSGIPGPDLATAPQIYQYIDKDATTNVTHSWVVQAVRNRVASDNNPTWTGQIRSVHAWLIDWETDRLVAILDPDISFEMPDTGVIYEPIMRDRIVRVAMKQRGMEGSVSGVIAAFGGTTMHSWETNLLWMKARPTRVFRLMVGNRNWRVLIGDVTIAPMRIPNNAVQSISFNFWSLDGPPRP